MILQRGKKNLAWPSTNLEYLVILSTLNFRQEFFFFPLDKNLAQVSCLERIWLKIKKNKNLERIQSRMSISVVLPAYCSFIDLKKQIFAYLVLISLFILIDTMCVLAVERSRSVPRDGNANSPSVYVIECPKCFFRTFLISRSRKIVILRSNSRSRFFLLLWTTRLFVIECIRK